MKPWLCDGCGATAPTMPRGGTVLPSEGWCECRHHCGDSHPVEYRLLCPACAPLLRPRVKTSPGAESAGPPAASRDARSRAGSDAPAPVDLPANDDGECEEIPRAPVHLDLCDVAREEET